MPRVLIVEDDSELRQVVCFALLDAGMEVEEAGDGRQALETLCRITGAGEKLDGVLLDILMPGGMDGWEVLEAIRKNPLWCHLPVIVLSGKATLAAEKERARRLGATHLQKTARFVDEVVERAEALFGGGGQGRPDS